MKMYPTNKSSAIYLESVAIALDVVTLMATVVAKVTVMS